MTFRQLLTGLVLKHDVCHSQLRDSNLFSTCLADGNPLTLKLRPQENLRLCRAAPCRAAPRCAALQNSANVAPLEAARLFFGMLIMHRGEFFYDT